MSPPALVETAVQASVVDLFRGLGVAVAPMPPASGRLPAQTPDLAAITQFTSPAASGILCLGCAMSVVQLAKGSASTEFAKEDWIREVVNQLMGGVKKRFLQFGVCLEVSLPVLATAKLIEQHTTGSPASKVFPFRTMRGDIVVILDATIDDRSFEYCGAVQLREEGEIILFSVD